MVYYVVVNTEHNCICKISDYEIDIQNQPNVKKIEISKDEFYAIKWSSKTFLYDGKNYKIEGDQDIENDAGTILPDQTISYPYNFKNEEELKKYINDQIKFIEHWLNSNKNHLLYNKWDNYKNFLKNFNLTSIQYPFRQDFIKYLDLNNQPSNNLLELPF